MLGWLAIFFVFKENTFTSATFELAPGQKVISTGPYAGSCGTRCTPERLFDEEKFLVRNLPSYVEYQKTVRYRLMPLVW
jgi:protein-S-isoprenylcysteine O-methyltransferase Ste14